MIAVRIAGCGRAFVCEDELLQEVNLQGVDSKIGKFHSR